MRHIPYHLAIYSINGRPFITTRDTVCIKRSFILQLSRLSSSRPSGYPPTSLSPKLLLTLSLLHVTHYKKLILTCSSDTYKPSLISTVAHTGRLLHSYRSATHGPSYYLSTFVLVTRESQHAVVQWSVTIPPAEVLKY